jgi:hypothetical protein
LFWLALFWLARRTASARRAPVSSRAPSRSRYKGCNTDLATAIVNKDASTTTMITTPAASAATTDPFELTCVLCSVSMM